MYVFKSQERRAYFEHNTQPLLFTSSHELDLKVTKCFIPTCKELRVDGKMFESSDQPKLCPDCMPSGFSVWFCAGHDCHEENDDYRSHESLISKQLCVSEFLRLNEQICDEIEMYTEGDLAEVVCICFEENWSVVDLMGNKFFPTQNRRKLRRHFESKYHLNLDDYRDGL